MYIIYEDAHGSKQRINENKLKDITIFKTEIVRNFSFWSKSNNVCKF